MPKPNREVTELKNFCKTFPQGALQLASYVGLTTDASVHNWIKRKTIPYRHSEIVHDFIRAKRRTLRVFTNKDKKGITRRTEYV